MSFAAYRPRLIVMAKAAQAGRVKTRLSRGIGVARATGFYRHALEATVRRLRDARRWQMIVAVNPDTAMHDPVWPAGIAVMGQGPGNLGDRMGRVFETVPPGPAVIIGSDVPDIATSDIAEAFAKLRGHDAVIGPSPDGGYWLVGAARTRPQRGMFDHVRWSSAETLADTMANLDTQRVAILRERDDIDTADDYRAWLGGA